MAKHCICIYQLTRHGWQRAIDHPKCPVRSHGKRTKWTVIT